MAPWTAAVDEEARYPQQAHTCLVIEEVARAGVSASLIPAVDKVGSLPVQIGGSEALEEQNLTRLAARQGGFSSCLSEPDGGSDGGFDAAAAMTTR